MMQKPLHILNACLTIPFGIAAYLFPQAAFEPFGFALDATAIMLTKGYAAAALGYGLAFWFTRNIRESGESGAATGLIAASLAFNSLEALLQLPLAIEGVAGAPLWITGVSHALLALLSLAALLTQFRKQPA